MIHSDWEGKEGEKSECWLTRINESKQCQRQMALISLNFILFAALVWRWNEAGIQWEGVESGKTTVGGLFGGKMNYGITQSSPDHARGVEIFSIIVCQVHQFRQFPSRRCTLRADKTWIHGREEGESVSECWKIDNSIKKREWKFIRCNCNWMVELLYAELIAIWFNNFCADERLNFPYFFSPVINEIFSHVVNLDVHPFAYIFHRYTTTKTLAWFETLKNSAAHTSQTFLSNFEGALTKFI